MYRDAGYRDAMFNRGAMYRDAEMPCTEMPHTEMPCTEMPVPPSLDLPLTEISSVELTHTEMPQSPLSDSRFMMEMESTPARQQSSGNRINLFGNLQQPQCSDMIRVCEGNNDKEFMPLVEKYKGRFKNNAGTYVCYIVVS